MVASTKERDLAGTAAFEVALQHIMVRQDRSYHFVQLMMAISSLVFIVEVCFVFLFFIVLPVFTIKPVGRLESLQEYASLSVALLSAVCLFLLRTGNQRYAIEPGDQLMHRLNRTIMEPCLGMHFDCATGKLLSDAMWCTNSSSLPKQEYTSQT